jgi:hypothetical protein
MARYRTHPAPNVRLGEFILALKNCVESWADERLLSTIWADFLEECDAFRDYRSLY